MNLINTIAPGARVVIRDAEWLVRKVDRTSTGGRAGATIMARRVPKALDKPDTAKRAANRKAIADR